MKNIGQRIKEFRKKSNLTQEQLADYLNVTHKAVSKWECGVTVPDLSLIVPLARVLHVTTDELLGMDVIRVELEREKYDSAMEKYRDCEMTQLNYAWARNAVVDFPNVFDYTEWLAYAEYRLAFEECLNIHGSIGFIEEMTDNALRRLEKIIENCSDRVLVRKAIIDKIMILSFLGRNVEADWSAEFEYADPNIKTANQALLISESGRELLLHLEEKPSRM